MDNKELKINTLVCIFLCCGPKYAVKLNEFNVFAAIMFKVQVNRNKQANVPSNMD